MPEKPLRILVDMDGTIAEFEQPVLETWRQRFPDRVFIPADQRKAHKMRDDYPPEYRQDLVGIYNEPGFFEHLLPIPGAISALHTLDNLGHQIFICTTPLESYNNCLEKVSWVRKNLGEKWVRKIIITSDKTLVHGDIFIDDAPELTGIVIPTWEHVLFDQPYNRDVNSKRRLNWINYKEVLEI